MREPQMSEKYEELIRKYPDLFQQSAFDEFNVGEGWFNIIDILCGLLCKDVLSVRARIDYNKGKGKDIDLLELELVQAMEKLPIITDIKEKYGGLRFYLENDTEDQDKYVEFAEAMASKICNVCGNPGERKIGQTLCDVHYKDLNTLNTISSIFGD